MNLEDTWDATSESISLNFRTRFLVQEDKRKTKKQMISPIIVFQTIKKDDFLPNQHKDRFYQATFDW